jgi:hypothetical protein
MQLVLPDQYIEQLKRMIEQESNKVNEMKDFAIKCQKFEVAYQYKDVEKKLEVIAKYLNAGGEL